MCEKCYLYYYLNDWGEKTMPLTKKGKKIMRAMDKEYGKKKGKQVFYASKNAKRIKEVEGRGGGRRGRK